MTAAERDSATWSVVGALVLVQVFFGLHYLAAKLVLEEIPPRAWALVRVASAAVLLLAFARISGRRLFRSPADLARLALLSIFGVVVNQVCFVEGLARTTATHSSLIVTSIPVLTLLFAFLLGREKLRARKLAAVVVASVGVILVIRPGSSAETAATLLGDVLTLVNAASYALFLVISKPLLARLDPLGATATLLACGSVGVAVVGLPELASLDAGAVSPHVWWLGLFIVVFPTAAAYLLQYWALVRVDSSVVAFFIFLQPVIATTLSVLLLGDRPGWPVILGGGLIFAGVVITVSRRRSPRLGAGAAPAGP